MNINWFTVIAQVINFLVLVWLLKKFLYKPILKAVNEREKRIADQLEDANAKEAEAQKGQDEFAQKNADFEQSKKERMDQSIAETKEERERLLDEARNAANALTEKLTQASKEAKQRFATQLIQKSQEQVFSIARKTLSDLASQGLEEQMTQVFVHRINTLDDAEKDQFLAAFKENIPAILLHSAFALAEVQQKSIQEAISKLVGTEIQLNYETEPQLISGIELKANGYKLAWSIPEYLDSLEESATMKLENTDHASK